MATPKYKYTFDRKLGKVLDISAVRGQKLLEIVQYTFVYLFLALVGGIFLEKIFPKEDDKTLEAYSTSKLLGIFSLRVAAISILIFYIYKIGTLIPFLFHFTPEYKPSMKGESILGASIVVTFALYRIQPSFIAMFGEIARRFGGVSI